MKKIFLLAIFSFTISNLFANEIIKNEVLKNLRCLVCQGQSVHDSDSFSENLPAVHCVQFVNVSVDS